MQAPPRLDGTPPQYSRSGKRNVVLIVLGVIFGTILLVCLGGGFLLWQSGGGDTFACSDLTSKGMHKEVIAPCRAVARRLPNSAAAHNELGWNLALDGQAQEALAECERAIEIEPTKTRYDSLAMALAISGRGEQALRIENEQVMVNGDVSKDEERLTLGMVYYAVGRKTEARRQWEMAKLGSNATARKLAAELEGAHS